MKRTIGFFCILLTTLFGLLHSESCFASTCARAKSNMQSYQNYNHGYVPTCENCSQNPCECNPCASNACTPSNGCSPCNVPSNTGCNPGGCNNGNCNNAGCNGCDPCDPCAPVCGTECGISIVAIGIAIAAVIAAAAIIIASGNGSATHSQ